MRTALTLVLAAACTAPATGSNLIVDIGGARIHQTVLPLVGGPGRLIFAEFPPDATLAVLPSSHPAPLEQIAAAHEDRRCVAINGGFYDDRGAMGLVVHASEELAPLRPGGGSGVLIIDNDRPRILHRDHASGRPREALQSIDRLVDDGRSLVGPGARPDLDARSAIALRRDGTILLAAVFADAAVAREAFGRVELGPASSSTGLSLASWADLLARPVAEGGLGAITALNLDGGYSTALSAHAEGFALDIVAHRATINALQACLR